MIYIIKCPHIWSKKITGKSLIQYYFNMQFHFTLVGSFWITLYTLSGTHCVVHSSNPTSITLPYPKHKKFYKQPLLEGKKYVFGSGHNFTKRCCNDEVPRRYVCLTCQRFCFIFGVWRNYLANMTSHYTSLRLCKIHIRRTETQNKIHARVSAEINTGEVKV